MALRPLLGLKGCCRFSITCTRFAVYHLSYTSFPRSLVIIGKRLLRCNPFS